MIRRRPPTCLHLEPTAKETATTPLEEQTPPAEVATITRTLMVRITTQMTTVANTTTVEVVAPLTPLLVDSLAPTLPPSKFVDDDLLSMIPWNGCEKLFLTTFH